MTERTYRMNRTAMLQHHLEHNHFPAIDRSFVPVAEAAIEAATEWRFDTFDGNEGWEALDTVLTLPNGVEKTVFQVMEELHLWDFVPTAMAVPEDDEFVPDEEDVRGDR